MRPLPLMASDGTPPPPQQKTRRGVCVYVCVCVGGGGLRPFRMMASDVLTLQQRTVEGVASTPSRGVRASLLPATDGECLPPVALVFPPPHPQPTKQKTGGGGLHPFPLVASNIPTYPLIHTPRRMEASTSGLSDNITCPLPLHEAKDVGVCTHFHRWNLSSPSHTRQRRRTFHQQHKTEIRPSEGLGNKQSPIPRLHPDVCIHSLCR